MSVQRKHYSQPSISPVQPLVDTSIIGADEERKKVTGKISPAAQPQIQLLDLDLGIPFDGTPFLSENVAERLAEPDITFLPRVSTISPEVSADNLEPNASIRTVQPPPRSSTIQILAFAQPNDFGQTCVNPDGRVFEVDARKSEDKQSAEKQLPTINGNALEDYDQQMTLNPDADAIHSLNRCSGAISEASIETCTGTPSIDSKLSREGLGSIEIDVGKGGQLDQTNITNASSVTPHQLAITRLPYPNDSQSGPSIQEGDVQGSAWAVSAEKDDLEKTLNKEEILFDKSNDHVSSLKEIPVTFKEQEISFLPQESNVVMVSNDRTLDSSRHQPILEHKSSSSELQKSVEEKSTPELIVQETFSHAMAMKDQPDSKGSEATTALPPSQSLPLPSMLSSSIPTEKDTIRRAQQNQDAISYISTLGVRIGNNVYVERDSSTISSSETSTEMHDVQTILTALSSSTPTIATSVTTSPTRSMSESFSSQQWQRSPSEHDKTTDLASKAVIDKSLAAIQDSYLSEAKQPRTASRLPHMASFPRLKGHNERASVGKAIADAASEGNAAKLTELVQDYPRLVDTRTSYLNDRPKTALMRAALAGHINCMEILKKNGANVSTSDERNRTALHLAIAAHQVNSVRWLIDSHSEVGPIVTRKGVIDLKEVSDIHGSRPLHFAAKRNHRDIAEILIAAGASLEAADNMGRTPLHAAVMNGHLDMCLLLLSKVAYMNALDADQMTPLHWAVKSNHVRIVDCLLAEGADRIIYDRFGRSPMHYAVDQGQLEVVERFYTESQDLERTTKSGETPLHLACSKNHLSVVKALLKHGVEVNTWTIVPSPKPSPRSVFPKTLRREATDSLHTPPSTPLHYACLAGHYDSAEQLLQFGAWINAPQEDGKTPLMLSVESNNHQLVSLLLQGGAQPNAATSGVCLTALHIACRKVDLESTKLLIEHGANARARTRGVPPMTPSEYVQKASERETSAGQKKAVLDYLRSQTIQHLFYPAESAQTSPRSSRVSTPQDQRPSTSPGQAEVSPMPPPESMGISLGPNASRSPGKFRPV